MSLPLIPPALVLIAVIAVIYGALFYLWKGRGWTELGLFMLAAMVGFWVGQLVALLLNLDVLKVGQIHLIEGTIFAWLFMLAIAWLRR
jgi:hypothetical protein